MPELATASPLFLLGILTVAVTLAVRQSRPRPWVRLMVPYGLVAVIGWQLGVVWSGAAAWASFDGSLTLDGLASAGQSLIVLVAAALAALIPAQRQDSLPWLMAATMGAYILPAASDASSLLLGAAWLTISLALWFGRGSAREGFGLLAGGGLSLAVLAFGISWLYGLTGTTRLSDMAGKLVTSGSTANGPILLTSLLITGGLAMGMGGLTRPARASDRHPVFQAGFAAVVPILAGVPALMRWLHGALLAGRDAWIPVLVIVASVMMLGGTLLALSHHSLRRLVACLTLGQTGTLLLAVLAASQPAVAAESLGALVFGLAAVAMATVGAHAALSMLDDHEPSLWLEDAANLWARSRVASLSLALSLASLVGLPLAVGFWARFTALKATVGFANAAQAYGYVWLAILAALAAVVGWYPVLRVLRLVFRQSECALEPTPIAAMPWAIALVCTVAVGFLFLVPQPLWRAAMDAAAGF